MRKPIMIFIKCTGHNRDLNTMIYEINLRVKRFCSLTRQYVSQIKDVVTPHREILEVARKGDIDLAAELTRRHYELFRKGIIELLTQGLTTNDVVDSESVYLNFINPYIKRRRNHEK